MAKHLLTGFPGFIGKRLVAALLERDTLDEEEILEVTGLRPQRPGGAQDATAAEAAV